MTSTAHFDAPPAVASSSQWVAYAAAPSFELLGPLLQVAGSRSDELLELLEGAFADGGSWKVAQHLALAYVGELPFGRRDIVRALYFAGRATELSRGDARARVALAKVCWAKRIPLAVLREVELARASLEGEVASSPEDARRQRIVLGQCANLSGLSLAYLGYPLEAHAELMQAEAAGTLTVEAAVQLLLVAEPDHVACGEWAADRLLPFVSGLGGRAQAFALRAWRRRFLAVLCKRAYETGGANA